MNSQLVEALKLKMQPVAIILTDDKPDDGLHFKEGSMGGCVAVMLVAASRKGRIAFFDRKTFGCPGGGTGLGFGDRYGKFPIDCLLSTGDKEMAEQAKTWLEYNHKFLLQKHKFVKRIQRRVVNFPEDPEVFDSVMKDFQNAML